MFRGAVVLDFEHSDFDIVSNFNIDSLVKSRIGERHCPFRKKGFDTDGVKNSKLFEELATSSWNLADGVETPERGHRSEPI